MPLVATFSNTGTQSDKQWGVERDDRAEICGVTGGSHDHDSLAFRVRPSFSLQSCLARTSRSTGFLLLESQGSRACALCLRPIKCLEVQRLTQGSPHLPPVHQPVYLRALLQPGHDPPTSPGGSVTLSSLQRPSPTRHLLPQPTPRRGGAAAHPFLLALSSLGNRPKGTETTES